MNQVSTIEKDIDQIIWSMQLCSVYRYSNQKFWEHEMASHVNALAIDTVNKDGAKIPRSESVADHSWHMADIALLLAPKFPQLDIGKCLMQAVLHDKLEIIIGDADPIGKEGKGTDTHAFNSDKKQLKEEAEKQALATYLSQLNEPAKILQNDILQDTITLQSLESRFVKALDRIQPIAYILLRKHGVMEDDHIAFTLKYTSTYYHHFPELFPYYDGLVKRLLQSIADKQHINFIDLAARFTGLRADESDPGYRLQA